MAGEIDIGLAAEDRSSFMPANYTIICKDNPANLAGKITMVAIYATSAEMDGIEVAIFREGDPNTFSTVASVALAACPVGYKEYVVDLDVEIGDYIGIHWTSSNLRADLSGTGWWQENADYIPCTDQLFAFQADREMSLYGTGDVPAEGGVDGGNSGKMISMGLL